MIVEIFEEVGNLSALEAKDVELRRMNDLAGMLLFPGAFAEDRDGAALHQEHADIVEDHAPVLLEPFEIGADLVLPAVGAREQHRFRPGTNRAESRVIGHHIYKALARRSLAAIPCAVVAIDDSHLPL